MLQKVQTRDSLALNKALAVSFEEIPEDETNRLWKVILSFLECFPLEAGAFIKQWEFHKGFTESVGAQLRKMDKDEHYFVVYIRFTRARFAMVTYHVPGHYIVPARDDLISLVKRATITLSPVLPGQRISKPGNGNKVLAERVRSLQIRSEKISKVAPDLAFVLAFWVLRYLGPGRYKTALSKQAILEAILNAELPNLATEDDIDKSLDFAEGRNQVSVVENANGIVVISLLKAGREIGSAYFEQGQLLA